ncbi:MAG: flagellar basal body-associated FliL family protein [Pseudomonadota bacterium]
MKKLIVPLVLALVGLGGGVGAGLALKPPPEEPMEDPMGDMKTEDAAKKEEYPEKDPDVPAEGFDYVKLNNQFVVPLVDGSAIKGLIVISLSLEVTTGTSEQVYAIEPKLRDSFLQVLFDHANAGGFSGAFTKPTNMMVLRDSLLEIARRNLGDIVTDVLIVDLIRQDA